MHVSNTFRLSKALPQRKEIFNPRQRAERQLNLLLTGAPPTRVLFDNHLASARVMFDAALRREMRGAR